VEKLIRTRKRSFGFEFEFEFAGVGGLGNIDGFELKQVMSLVDY
jgi:hypothetical protein